MRNAEVIRQWQILRQIEAQRAGVTIHDLARLVEVSTRTIRRDLQALQEAGFAVYDEGDEHETKRWRLDAQPFRAVQDGLSVTDVAALYLSRSVVESMPGWPLAEELGAAFNKIERALNPRVRAFLGTLPQVLSAKAGPSAAAVSDRLVEVTRKLFEATRDRRTVTMQYFSAQSNRTKSYRIEPYRLALANGGVYIIAWVPQYDAFRTFAADRVERLSVGEETFRRTRDLPADPFGTSMGVFSGEPEAVELEFDARLAPFVRGRIWHDSQQLDVLTDGRVRLRLNVSNDWALRSWILGFGAGARVVSPSVLAEAIAEEHRRAITPVPAH